MSTPGSSSPQHGPDAERWAPFPVQDWSRLPGGTHEGSPGAVDPTWGPPDPGAHAGTPTVDRRPRWLPLLVVITVTVLVAGGLWSADRLAGGTRSTATARFLPADGSVTYQRRDSTSGGETTSSKHVQESARQSGSLILGGLDATLGQAVAGVVGLDHLDRVRFWRTTGTMIGNLGNSQQDVRVYEVDDGVALVAASDQSGADVYSPALVELPADVAAGDTWSGEGTVGSRHYRSEFAAAAAEPGCLRVSGTIAESTTGGATATPRQVERTWCQGRGLVREQSRQGRTIIRTEAVAPFSIDPTLRTADESWTWSDPAGWRRRDFDLLSADATLGSGGMTGAPAQIPPVLAASGLVLRGTSGDDIVATTPKTVDRWTTLWRMHPGGTLLSLSTFGDVVVATTSRRQAVGYSDAGVRLWTLDLDDVAWWAPVRVDRRLVAVGDAAGAVRLLDVLTGQVRWRVSVGAQLSAPLAADSSTVVALEAGGSTSGWAVDTGAQRWSRDLPGSRVTVFGETAVVSNQATLEALDLATGRHRWLLPQAGTLDAMQPFGDELLVATQLRTVAVDERGGIVATLPAYERLTVVGDVVVGWGATQAELRDHSGAVLTRIDTPDATLARALPATLAYRQGVIVFGHSWTFTTWSDEP